MYLILSIHVYNRSINIIYNNIDIISYILILDYINILYILIYFIFEDFLF